MAVGSDRPCLGKVRWDQARSYRAEVFLCKVIGKRDGGKAYDGKLPCMYQLELPSRKDAVLSGLGRMPILQQHGMAKSGFCFASKRDGDCCHTGKGLGCSALVSFVSFVKGGVTTCTYLTGTPYKVQYLAERGGID